VRGKKDVEKELIYAEARIVSLTEQLGAAQAERSELKAQVDKLQDALISVRAPAAYLDQQDEKYQANLPKISEETLEKNRIAKEVTESYSRNLEGNLFNSPEDLDDLLVSGILSEHKPPTSIHGNSES
jgi:chromosome segregation ATPase